MNISLSNQSFFVSSTRIHYFQLIYYQLIMLYLVFCCILVLNPALSRHMPHYSELDDEDHQLLRAAYDTPSYDHDDYEEDNGKLDLMKDGLWALKAKIKELKAFDKALVAHMLSTKIKVKDLLENHMGEILKHHHKKEKPYSYQAPSYQQPDYPAPAPQYGAQYAHDPYYGH